MVEEKTASSLMHMQDSRPAALQGLLLLLRVLRVVFCSESYPFLFVRSLPPPPPWARAVISQLRCVLALRVGRRGAPPPRSPQKRAADPSPP